MKAKLQVPSPVLFQEVEIEGTPDEIAAFVKALGNEMPAPLPWGRIVTIPTVWALPDVCPVDGGAHRYPEVWMSVSPPACEKCHQAQPTLQVTNQPTSRVSLNPGNGWQGQREVDLPASTTQSEDQYFWRGEGP